MRRSRAWLAALVLLGACAARLPSALSLGAGPRAEIGEGDDSGARASLRSGAAKASPATAAGGAEESDAAGHGLDGTVAVAADAAPAPTPEASDAGAPDGEPPTALARLDALLGEYSGHDTTTIRLPGLPEQKSPDPQARITVERQSDTEVKIVIVYTPTGGPFCTLVGKVQEDAVTIEPGQTCPDLAVDANLTGVVTRGTATVTGRQLLLDLEADIEVDVGGERRSGELEYHFEGSRKVD